MNENGNILVEQFAVQTCNFSKLRQTITIYISINSNFIQLLFFRFRLCNTSCSVAQPILVFRIICLHTEIQKCIDKYKENSKINKIKMSQHWEWSVTP